MLEIKIDGNSLTWNYQDRQIKKSFDTPICRCLEMKNSGGIALILESRFRGDSNDAFIMNVDGSLRRKIAIPTNLGFYYYFFYDVYYERDLLTFFVTSNGTYDVACHYDENGNFIGKHITK